MLWFKILILFVFSLTVLCVEADQIVEDVNSELSTTAAITAFPIVLQLSTTLSSDDLRPPIMVENHIVQEHIDNHLNANDIEVFDDKLGQQMAKQEEEEAVVETEAEPIEEAAKEETKPEEEEAKEDEPESEASADNKVEPEEPKEEETPVEADETLVETTAQAPTEEKDETVSETANETTNEKPAAEAESEIKPDVEAVTATDNSDSEMPNDEPSKDNEKSSDETTIATATDNNDKNNISCFTCTSNDDMKCHKSPTQQTPCPKGNASKKEKQYGCFTLYETETNITMRGCVDELAEEGLKYCLTNEKFCELCYETGCNNKTAPNLGNMQQFNTFLLLITMMIWMTIGKWV